MTRVATIAMHRTLFDAIGRSQARLAAPSNSTVAAISRLSSTMMAVVSEP